MPQQKFTEVLEHFLELRERQKFSVMYNDGMFEAKAKELDELREQLNAMVRPGVISFDQSGLADERIARSVLCANPEGAAAVEAYEKTTQASSEPEVQADEPKPVMQYYFKSNGCKAKNSDDESCTCWHDEGTGLHKAERFSLHHPFLKWREKPAQVDDAEVRVEDRAEMYPYRIALQNAAAMSGIKDYGPRTNTVILSRELPEMTEEEAREVGSVCINDFGDGMATCKVISLHDVRQIYKRIVEKFGV